MRTLLILTLFTTSLSAGHRVQRMVPRADRAMPKEFPYFAALHLNGKHLCGGSLIGRLHVLTAGHCVYTVLRYHQLDFQTTCSVRVGSIESYQGRTHSVARLALHQGYVPDHQEKSSVFLPNDIAIVTLAKPVQTDANVQIMGLPNGPGYFPVGAKPVTAGFGNTEINGLSSRILRKAVAKVISNAACDKFIFENYYKRVWSYQLCVKYAPGYGACQGDSGGPVVYDNKLVGVISGGSPRCGSEDPEVLTKVSSYLEFIYYEMRKDAIS